MGPSGMDERVVPGELPRDVPQLGLVALGAVLFADLAAVGQRLGDERAGRAAAAPAASASGAAGAADGPALRAVAALAARPGGRLVDLAPARTRADRVVPHGLLPEDVRTVSSLERFPTLGAP